jgi:hypothetical protein
MIGSTLDLEPRSVQGELFANRIIGGDLLRVEMENSEAHVGSSGGRDHHAKVSPSRPVSDRTVRAKLRRLGAMVPLELSEILRHR